jgi:hypothetical protein
MSTFAVKPVHEPLCGPYRSDVRFKLHVVMDSAMKERGRNFRDSAYVATVFRCWDAFGPGVLATGRKERGFTSGQENQSAAMMAERADQPHHSQKRTKP